MTGSAKQTRGEGYLKVSATAVGTNSGATATITTTAGQRTIATTLSVSGDAAALVTLESPPSTVLWQKRYAAAFIDTVYFTYGEYEAVDGQSILVKISASTSHCEANLAGVKAGL